MPLLFENKDITKMHVDIVVNAAKNSLLGGGGVDGAIHRAAGPKLLEECRELGGCETGSAKLTKGYNMPCRYIIHTVGPIYRDGRHGEPELLRSCYRSSLELAYETGCESIAFPAISTGVYGYPKEEAKLIAVSTVREFLETHDMTVYLVFFDMPASDSDLERYLLYHRGKLNAKPSVAASNADTLDYASNEERDCCAAVESPKSGYEGKSLFGSRGKGLRGAKVSEAKPVGAVYQSCLSEPMVSAEPAVPDFRKMLDESFSEMLLRKIDERGMTDTECYKRANIDRKLFSKIRADRLYKPSKPTAIAFALALQLDESETEELLSKAGYALSGSTLFDVIIRYYIEQGVYDVLKINEALFRHDQTLLGA